MVGEEKVDKTSAGVPANKTSDAPTGIPAEVHASSAAGAPAKGAPFICDVCGKPFDTKHALSGHMSVHSKKTETTEGDLPDDYLDEREILDRIIAEATPTRKRKSIVRLASRHLGNKRESIEALAEALRLADMQPHLRNLILKNWASHMDIADIEDILDPEKKEEKKKEGEQKIEGDKEKEEKKTPRNLEEVLKKGRDRKFDRLDSLQVDREIAKLEKEIAQGTEDNHKEGLTIKDLELWKLQEENRRLRERDNGHRDNPDSEMRERVSKLEDELRQRDADLRQRDLDRMQKLEDEVKESRKPQESQMNREDITQMVLRTIEAQTKKLTPDDVERIVQRAVGDFRSTTKEELVYNEARDKMHLEERKLDESGKTRDVIGGAIRDGFGHAGRIISRMMTEEGGDTGMPVKGYADQGGNMMQVACPTCNAVITAPVGSPVVVCPGCGKRWEVERGPKAEQIPPKAEEEKPLEEFIPEDKKVIEKSLEDAKKGRITPLETSDAPAIIPKQTTDATENVTYESTTVDVPDDISEPRTIDVPDDISEPTDVEKIAEGIAIGEGVKKLEEELKKEEKKPARLKRCPVCKKPFKNKRAVTTHIVQKHPEYYKK